MVEERSGKRVAKSVYNIILASIFVVFGLLVVGLATAILALMKGIIEFFGGTAA